MQLLKVRQLKGLRKLEKQNEAVKISASILQLTLISQKITYHLMRTSSNQKDKGARKVAEPQRIPLVFSQRKYLKSMQCNEIQRKKILNSIFY